MSLAISNPPFLNRLKIKIGPFTDSNIIILIVVPFTKKLAHLVVASGIYTLALKSICSQIVVKYFGHFQKAMKMCFTAT